MLGVLLEEKAGKSLSLAYMIQFAIMSLSHFFSLHFKWLYLNICLQMKYTEKILIARTSILDLFRKGHIEEGAADTSWTGLEGSEHRTNMGEIGAPSAPPFTASFICF